MSSTMQAAILYGKEDVRLENVPVPDAGAGELLVRVRAALTCGTDVKVFRRGYHAKMIVPPAVFGHEMAGDVVAVGKGVRDFRVGRKSRRRKFGTVRSMFFLPAQSIQSLRESAFQQRRICRIHDSPGTHCAAEHV